MNEPKLSLAYRPDVQGLRAIAVALVVLAHAHVPGFAGGFIGVDVFFVLSGYLITGLLIRERQGVGRIHYGRFLSRRLRRLLPAMLVMLLAVLGLAAVLLSAYETRMQTGSFAYAATWTSNLFFVFADFDYFSALQARDLFLHTWSLGVEEQFYIVWPWLVMLAFVIAGLVRGRSVTRKTLTYLLCIVFVLSLLLCLHWSVYNPLMGFYMMPARGWQFALGALVFVAGLNAANPLNSDDCATLSASARTVLALVGLLLIGGSAVLLHPSLAYPGYWALFPSLGAALVIFAGQGGARTLTCRLLSSRPAVWLGDRSYSLYLWHWPVLLLGSAYGFSSAPADVALLIVVSTLLAAASYRFVELPFWKGRFSSTGPIPVVAVSVALIAATIAGAQGLKSRISANVEVASASGDYNPRRDLPEIYDVDVRCDTWHRSAEVAPCIRGRKTAPRTAVLLGDSIGAQWVSMLPQLYPSPDWQLVVLTKSACAMVDEDYYYEKIGRVYTVCSTWRDSALDYLDTLQPDVVFVGSASHYEFTAQQWTEGSARVLERLAAAAGQVVVIPGTPALSFNGPSCLESPYRFSARLDDSRRECEEGTTTPSSEIVAGYLETAAANFANVHVLNLNDLVCPLNRCAARTVDGLVVFRDSRHLTDRFVRVQIPEVASRLKRLQLSNAALTGEASLTASD